MLGELMYELAYEMKASDPRTGNAAPGTAGSGTDSKRCWVALVVCLETGGPARSQGGY